MSTSFEHQYQEYLTKSGYVQAVPRPSREDLEQHYREHYFQTPSGSYQEAYSSDELAFLRVSSALANHCLEQMLIGRSRRLLDLGCGEGFFAAHMAELGWEVACVDFSSAGVSRFNPDLLRFFSQSSIEDCLSGLSADDNEFDVINLSNVLEHMLQPEEALAHLLDKLKRQKHGVIRLVVPNDFSPFQEELLKKGLAKKTWFCPPEHLNYFNLQNLTSFLDEMGFQVLEVLGDFPIEWFLANEASNYHLDASKGRGAHGARVMITNFMASRGLEKYRNFCRAAAQLETGRDLVFYASAK